MSQAHLATLLSSNDCERILNKFNQEAHTNLKLKTFTIVEATEVTGFLGEYFHLTIEGVTHNNKETELNTDDDDDQNDATQLKFFIKSRPPVNEQHEKVTIFRKESSLYASLLPKLQNYSSAPWCPKIYLCQRNVLVLEDLNNQHFYSLSSKDILGPQDMFPVLNGLAAMHASSIVYEFKTKESIEFLYSESLKEVTIHPDVPWFTTGLKAIIEIAKTLAKYQTEEAQQFIASELSLHLKSVYFMVNPSLIYRNVLCHRDTWGGNILLHRKDPLKPAMFVDFQTCRYCPPAIDVIFTLFMNLAKQERLEKQTIYLKFYYKQLLHHIEHNISSDISVSEVVFSETELSETVKEFALFGFLYRALAISILRVPKEFVTDYYKNVERSEKLLQYMKDNEEFCQLMTESIDHIIEAVTDNSIKKYGVNFGQNLKYK